MKGFNNSTKMQMGHNFQRSSVMVPAHQRAMPMKKVAQPTTMSDPPIVDSPTPPAMARGGKVTDLSATGYPTRHTRLTLKETGQRGLRTPRSSQIEPTTGDETGLAKGGSVRDPRTPLIKSGC